MTQRKDQSPTCGNIWQRKSALGMPNNDRRPSAAAAMTPTTSLRLMSVTSFLYSVEHQLDEVADAVIVIKLHVLYTTVGKHHAAGHGTMPHEP